MADILFATYDGGGNLPPALGIARVLQSRGHRVRFLGQESQREQLADFEFRAYDHAPAWSPVAAPGVRSTIALLGALTSTGMGRDLLATLDEDPADVVVIDVALLGVLAAVRQAGVRYIALVHAFFAWFDGAFARGPIGTLARLRGLNARTLWNAADLVVVCSDRELDPAGEREVPANVVWSGAVSDAPTDRADRADLAPSRRVLVSFSTLAFAGQRRILQKVLDAVAGLDIEVVVTTGPSLDPADLDAPDNATVHRYLPHNELMPGCAAVIGHGGHATTFRALAYDLPVLVIPINPLADQAMVGNAIAKAGAGLLLSRSARRRRIRGALTELLDVPSHRQAAASIGARVRETDGAVRGADRILEAAEEA